MAQVDDVGERLLRAAGAILMSDGAAALTVRRIARDAGASTMNVYSRFGSKDGVVDRLYLDGFHGLRAAVAAAHHDDPLEDVRECGRAYRRFARAHPAYYAVMFGGVVPDFEPSPAAAEFAAGTLAQLAERLEAAMDAGALVRTDPMRMAAVVWATCHGVVSLEIQEVGPGAIDWDDVFETASAAVLTGLANGTAAATATATTSAAATRPPAREERRPR